MALALLLAQILSDVDPRAFPPTVQDFVEEEYRTYRATCELDNCPPPLPEQFRKDRLKEVSDWSCNVKFADGAPLGVSNCTYKDQRLKQGGYPATCHVRFEFALNLSRWTFLDRFDPQRGPNFAAPQCEAPQPISPAP